MRTSIRSVELHLLDYEDEKPTEFNKALHQAYSTLWLVKGLADLMAQAPDDYRAETTMTFVEAREKLANLQNANAWVGSLVAALTMTAHEQVYALEELYKAAIAAPQTSKS